MPSPVAHTAAGFLIYRFISLRGSSSDRHFMLAATLTLSLLPDVDAIIGFLFRNIRRYHNGITHSLLVGLILSATIGTAASFIQNIAWIQSFSVTLISYELHIIMDYLAGGVRGVMLFWPLSERRFRFPVKTFYGVKWNEGILSGNHLRTIVSEIALVVVVFTLFYLIKKAVRIGAQSPTYNHD